MSPVVTGKGRRRRPMAAPRHGRAVIPALVAVGAVLVSAAPGAASARPSAGIRVLHRGHGPPATAAGLLHAAYRAARAAKSFELVYGATLSLGASVSRQPLFWVLQTPASSRAVERVGLSVAGKTGTVYTLFTARRICVWHAAGEPALGFPATPHCSASTAASYDAEVFPFLSLTRPQLVGSGHLAGATVTGVAGGLVQITRTAGGTSRVDYGRVTLWVADKTLLPVAIAVSGGKRTLELVSYRDWNSSAVHFPPETPSPSSSPSTASSAAVSPKLGIHTGVVLGALFSWPHFPSSVQIDNHDRLSGLRWTRPTPTTAIARGDLVVDLCSTNCAGGPIKSLPVEVVASRPRACLVSVYDQSNGTMRLRRSDVYSLLRGRLSNPAGAPSTAASLLRFPPVCHSK